ncbi:hypothetical protein SODALDRAFT_332282 [Sodiomyces alkalinus F11]|uniref:Clathrin light chain n=1 Tax=Sodiomyces alkalinus (strain CBS 110278 / VKM F-3762 / F11) TaxID=1314773 RepID=A0A3N2Q058_SODAK|nr:hypothetical protein SODALDRAFT_332282 [Sodiomyces alkalinus F11]ROT40122.1 hypothetical protein SODALDRAFT_332282 [Sodiomyces alkalinus F11]
MVDRFPSLEEFDSVVETDIKPSGIEPSAEDFIAREKAFLGDDAEQFAGNNNGSTLELGHDFLAGDNAEQQKSTHVSDCPNVGNEHESVASAGNITKPSIDFKSGFQTTVEDEAEPEVTKEWRERRDVQIQKRAELYAAQREETIKEAQHQIDDFYENYNSKKEKSIAQTRKDVEQFMANREDTVSGGTSWERIAKLVDVSGKGLKGGAAGSGKERFRELLVSLKKDSKAPGAEGY